MPTIKKKTTKQKINNNLSLYLRMLHQENGVSKAELARRYPEYAKRSIYRHAGKPVVVDGAKANTQTKRGRPKKLTERDERHIIKTMLKVREERASFTCERVREESDMTHVSTKTVRRVLHKNGYHYLQSRKKGLVTEQDKKKRLKYAKGLVAKPVNFWTKDIKFYFDGVGFAHKTNPHAEARSTSTRTWRKKKEGLSLTTKGKKEGSGGKMANFYVAIAHTHGVVMCKQYNWKVTGKTFADFVLRTFPETFERCNAGEEKKFLQDGDPRQNSKVAREAFETVSCEMFAIPARSPDLNPIENMFHLIRKQLKEDAIKQSIQHETYKEFSQRVHTTITNFPKDIINRTIESMKKRIEMVVASKGERIKY